MELKMAGIRIEGNISGIVAEVGTGGYLKTQGELSPKVNPGNVGAIKSYVENDPGFVTGIVDLTAPEVDVEYRGRVALDTVLDEEVFNYTAQNTGKHTNALTNFTATWTAGQFTTNTANITTVSSGALIATYAFFPMIGTQTLSIDAEIGFSAQPNANTFVEWGVGIVGAATVAPTEGVFFRLSAAGLQGIASFNGTEVSTGVFPLSNGTGTWVYANNKRYQFILYHSAIETQFWVNDGTGAAKLGSIALPIGLSRMTMANSGQFFYKHRILGGAAGSILQTVLGAYSVRTGGGNHSTVMSTLGNRLYGSYQGQSGGTMGSLANYANSANPTAAVPTNTTAALGTGLGGQFWETASAAVNTDLIICSFQVPAATVNFSGRRLVIRGVSLMSYVQAAITGGPLVAQYSLAFGHNALSLATGEAAASKAPRRIPLPQFTQAQVVTQAASTTISQPGGSYVDFGDALIYVNPGEFVALVKKKVGTADTVGTIAHVVGFVYGWE